MAEKESGRSGTGRWHWTVQDGGQLAAKFKAAIVACLHEYGVKDEDSVSAPDELAEQVLDLDCAASALDECAANCHVVAKAIRGAWGLEPPADDAPDVAVADRLYRAVGKPVLLARTTIDELRGKELVLAQVDGGNAIIQHENDYWGTPADRLIVLPTAEEEEILNGAKGKEVGPDKPSPRVAEFLERLEAGLQPPILIYSGNAPGVVRLDVCGEKGGEIVSLGSLPPELKKRLSEARKHTSELVLANQAPQMEDDFYFRLRRGELGNALQFLTMMNRTGVLETGFAQDQSEGDGCVFVSGTRITHAEYGNFDGVRAIAEMLTLDHLSMSFQEGVKAPVQTIHSSTDQLMIEAAIQADELISQRRH
jgi:hypothetical protein